MFARWLDSDVGYSFRTSPVAIAAAVIALVCIFASAFAGWVTPHNPFNLSTLELSDARLPPDWYELGSRKYLLGTDDQGRDILSAVIYSVTVVTFIVAGAVSWPQTGVMLLAASLGGYGGARMARNIKGPWLRRLVIAVGSALTAYYFYKTLG